MNIDFSTISPLGVLALMIVGSVILTLLAVLLKNFKTISVNTEKLGISMQTTNEQFNKAAENNLIASRDCIKKQSNLAKHHILNFEGDLRNELLCRYDFSESERATVWILVALFVAELKYQVFNNFTENHIGNNDAEIEQYTRMRTREYQAYAESFFDSYDWTLGKYRLKEAIADLPESFFYDRLLVIYKDGKSMEKQIK